MCIRKEYAKRILRIGNIDSKVFNIYASNF
jgi:hypothetical protein